MRFLSQIIVSTALISITSLTAGCQNAANSETPAAAQSQTAGTAKHIDAKGAAATLKADTNVVVLDIRTPKEYVAGHIDGAVLIDFKSSSFPDEISKLNKDAAYIVHCHSGGRSTKSLEIFKSKGFTNVTHLDGGIAGWKQAGLPLSTPE